MAKILCIDIGMKKSGIALSDATNTIAIGKSVIRHNSADGLLEHIVSLCQKDDIARIIVGYPKTMAGGKSIQTEKIEKIACRIQNKTLLPVELFDERLTTKQAQKIQRNCKKNVGDDLIAAEIMLQTYLEKENKIKAEKLRS